MHMKTQADKEEMIPTVKYVPALLPSSPFVPILAGAPLF